MQYIRYLLIYSITQDLYLLRIHLYLQPVVVFCLHVCLSPEIVSSIIFVNVVLQSMQSVRETFQKKVTQK